MSVFSQGSDNSAQTSLWATTLCTKSSWTSSDVDKYISLEVLPTGWGSRMRFPGHPWVGGHSQIWLRASRKLWPDRLEVPLSPRGAAQEPAPPAGLTMEPSPAVCTRRRVHHTELTMLKWTTQWHLVSLPCCAAPTSSSETFSLLQNKSSYSLTAESSLSWDPEFLAFWVFVEWIHTDMF